MKSISFRFFTIIFALIFSLSEAFPQKTISITDFGYAPGSRRNVVPFVQEALKQCAGDEAVTLVFPKGRYDFWQDLSSTGNMSYRYAPGLSVGRSTTGIAMQGIKNVVVDGDSSEFIFHGNMQIASISGCENIVLKNFSADWDFPFMYQGTYLNATDEYIELEIDKEQYRYVIEDEKFYLTGEGWKAAPEPISYFDLFDRDTKEILYNTMDHHNSNVYTGKAEEIRPGVVRFYGKPDIKPPKGTYVNLMAGMWITTGMRITGSKDVCLKDLTIYHTLSNAVDCSKNENLSFDNANFVANEKKGRVFSVTGDVFHLVDTKGFIKVINCTHTGMMDDFLNICGAYISIDSIIGNNAVISGRRAGSVQAGEEMWFVDPSNYQRSKVFVVQSVERSDRGSKIIFTSSIPKEVKKGDFMENKTWTPDVEIRNCNVLRKNRSRGLLVTTPGKIVIENNYFRTGRSAIQIAGDMDYWFESGASLDVTIRNNVFENCLTSPPNCCWDEAIITIAPSHLPQNDTAEPYHRNIRIENNIFKTFDTPLVNARSVRGLTFRNNEIIRTYAFDPIYNHKPSFRLDGCREVVITGNKIHNEYMTRTIEAQFMKKSDIKVEGFSIIFTSIQRKTDGLNKNL